MFGASNDKLNPDDYVMYEYTFRISRITEISFLKKYACEFWGLEDSEKHLAIYDPNGEMIDPS